MVCRRKPFACDHLFSTFDSVNVSCSYCTTKYFHRWCWGHANRRRRLKKLSIESRITRESLRASSPTRTASQFAQPRVWMTKQHMHIRRSWHSWPPRPAASCATWIPPYDELRSIFVLHFLPHISQNSRICCSRMAWILLQHIQSLFLICLYCDFFVTQNDLTFLRIRSKKHEIMVAPGTARIVSFTAICSMFD